jgi:hypothetical protein
MVLITFAFTKTKSELDIYCLSFKSFTKIYYFQVQSFLKPTITIWFTYIYIYIYIYIFFFFFFFFFFVGTGVSTLGFMFARQALYHLSHHPWFKFLKVRCYCPTKGRKQPTTLYRHEKSPPRLEVVSHLPSLLLTFLICSSKYSRRLMSASDHLSLTQFKSSSWQQGGKIFSCRQLILSF